MHCIVPFFLPHDLSALLALAARQPLRIEPAISGAIVGQARHVPVADIASVDVPYRRSAADEDDAPGVVFQRLLGVHVRAEHGNRAVGERELWYAGDGLRSGEQNVAAGDVEEACDVGDVFRRWIALPWEYAVEAELSRLADCANDPDDCLFHEGFP